MEEKEPHALEMGEEEAQAAQEKDEEKGRRTLSAGFEPAISLIFKYYTTLLLVMTASKGKVMDFNRAYYDRHGHAQRHVDKKQRECMVDAIMSATGKAPKDPIARLDLEQGPERHSATRNIREGDIIAARAGRADLLLIFTHIDEYGRLGCMAFNNGRYEGEHRLREGEGEKVWGGMLMDFSPFSLTLRRLRLHPEEEGVMGCVEVHAKIERPLAAF